MEKRLLACNIYIELFASEEQRGVIKRKLAWALSTWIHSFFVMRISFIAELRRPEGPPSGVPYSYREEKEPMT